MKFSGILLVASLAAFSVHAEFRTWEDIRGKKYEAEFVRELMDKVTLRTADGQEVRIPVEEFSERDQLYMRVNIPPVFTVDFKRDPLVAPTPRGDWEEYVKTECLIAGGTAVITKTSNREFTSRLKAELFLIAEEAEIDSDNYILLTKTDSSFLFEPGKPHTFKAKPYTMRKYYQYGYFYSNQERGEVYAGYLLVVSDRNGKILTTKTDLGNWIEDPAVIQNLRDLAIRGAASIRSRHFDKAGKKAKVPRCIDKSPQVGGGG
jgi:hypothetical protein